jgi:glycosyltransferase involved in cell wall biosynthesis
MLILPSVCYEGFPMVIREAFALGVPVAASRVGSLPSIVDEGTNGVLFRPGDPGDLLDRVRAAWSNNGGLGRMGEAARAKFDREYTAETNYKALMRIYESAMAHRRSAQ